MFGLCLVHHIDGRYASLYFVVCVDRDANELLMLELIQHYVELLDRHFCNVCELDMVFNVNKVSCSLHRYG